MSRQFGLLIVCWVLLASGSIAQGRSNSPIGDCKDEACGTDGTVVEASKLQPDLLIRFKVPEVSKASDESPLRIEGEIIGATKRPPFVLRASVFKLMNDDESQKSRRYKKLPFGRLDVIAPMRPKNPFLLFPYDDAKLVRKLLKPGDEVLIGIEAFPLEIDENSKKLDVDVKVRRLVSW